MTKRRQGAALRNRRLRCNRGVRVLLGLLAHVEEQQADADTDGRVRDVEGRPVMRLSSPIDVDVEKIDDISEPEAINEVADGAAEDQVQPDLQQTIGDCGPE